LGGARIFRQHGKRGEVKSAIKTIEEGVASGHEPRHVGAQESVAVARTLICAALAT
jgi:hypothetical protein